MLVRSSKIQDDLLRLWSRYICDCFVEVGINKRSDYAAFVLMKSRKIKYDLLRLWSRYICEVLVLSATVSMRSG
jgi:hypothetical protein